MFVVYSFSFLDRRRVGVGPGFPFGILRLHRPLGNRTLPFFFFFFCFFLVFFLFWSTGRVSSPTDGEATLAAHRCHRPAFCRSCSLLRPFAYFFLAALLSHRGRIIYVGLAVLARFTVFPRILVHPLRVLYSDAPLFFFFFSFDGSLSFCLFNFCPGVSFPGTGLGFLFVRVPGLFQPA